MQVLLMLSMSMLLMPCFYACPTTHYQQNGICCQRCQPGYTVLKHCVVDREPSQCKPCREKTYMDLSNGLNNCFRCKICDGKIESKITVQACTSTSNTVCKCKPGYSCFNGETNEHECEWCKRTKPAVTKKHMKNCCPCV